MGERPQTAQASSGRAVIKSGARHDRELYRDSVQHVADQSKAINTSKSSFIAAAARAASNKSPASRPRPQPLSLQPPPLEFTVLKRPQRPIASDSAPASPATSTIALDAARSAPRTPSCESPTVESMAIRGAGAALLESSQRRDSTSDRQAESTLSSRRTSVSDLGRRMSSSNWPTVHGARHSSVDEIDPELVTRNTTAAAARALAVNSSNTSTASQSTATQSEYGTLTPQSRHLTPQSRHLTPQSRQLTPHTRQLSSGTQVPSKTLSAAAASQASKLCSADVEARATLPAHFISSLSAALKRNPSADDIAKEEAARAHTQRMALVEQTAARISAGEQLARQKSPSPSTPSRFENKTPSALAAAIKARPNVESRVAEIDYLVTTNRRRGERAGKRYRPTAQWSTEVSLRNTMPPLPHMPHSLLSRADILTTMTRPGIARTGSADTRTSLTQPQKMDLYRPTHVRAPSSLSSSTLGEGASTDAVSRPPSIMRSPTDSTLGRSETGLATMAPRAGKSSLRYFFKKINKGVRTAELAMLKLDNHISGSQQPLQPLPPATSMSTMRKSLSEKKKFNDERPWKNHRDANYVTEKERRRYERLWAANKGSHLKYLYGDAFMGNEVMGQSDSSGTKNPSIVVTSERPLSQGSDFGFRPHTSRVHNSALSPDTGRPDTPASHRTSLVWSDRASRTSLEGPPSIPSSMDGRSIHSNASKTSLDTFGQSLEQSLNDVHGYVVKRIWRRSKLSDDVLAKIWDLVDNNKDGTLDRESFVVGMWLVDQCLYGRKLPTKIDEGVWRSVGRLHLKVRVKKTRAHKRLLTKPAKAAVKSATNRSSPHKMFASLNM